MRLIDADALEKDIKRFMGGFSVERELFESIVDLQPIAYDKDNVSFRIREMFKHHNVSDKVKRMVIEIVEDRQVYE